MEFCMSDMSEMLKNFASMMEGKDIPDNIKEMLNSLQNSSSEKMTNNSNSDNNNNSSVNYNNNVNNNISITDIRSGTQSQAGCILRSEPHARGRQGMHL